MKDWLGVIGIVVTIALVIGLFMFLGNDGSYEDGYAVGYEAGQNEDEEHYQEGYADGYALGKSEGYANGIRAAGVQAHSADAFKSQVENGGN